MDLHPARRPGRRYRRRAPRRIASAWAPTDFRNPTSRPCRTIPPCARMKKLGARPSIISSGVIHGVVPTPAPTGRQPITLGPFIRGCGSLLLKSIRRFQRLPCVEVDGRRGCITTFRGQTHCWLQQGQVGRDDCRHDLPLAQLAPAHANVVPTAFSPEIRGEIIKQKQRTAIETKDQRQAGTAATCSLSS